LARAQSAFSSKKKWDRPIVCNDGVTIAKEFELEDHEENLMNDASTRDQGERQ